MKPDDTFPPSPRLECNNISALPAELLIEIAEQLAATYSGASLASLNASCRRFHEATLPVLFRSLILVTRDPEDFVEVEREVSVEIKQDIPKAWSHVR